MNPIICDAIHGHCILEFDYDGKHRVVEPYCHGISRKGEELLRAIQIGGESSSRGFGFGKLWNTHKMTNVKKIEKTFAARDPDYNPDDSAMASIHCRV
jgi:hypothetical protein